MEAAWTLFGLVGHRKQKLGFDFQRQKEVFPFKSFHSVISSNSAKYSVGTEDILTGIKRPEREADRYVDLVLFIITTPIFALSLYRLKGWTRRNIYSVAQKPNSGLDRLGLEFSKQHTIKHTHGRTCLNQ
jgi:hypothetical protein